MELRKSGGTATFQDRLGEKTQEILSMHTIDLVAMNVIAEVKMSDVDFQILRNQLHLKREIDSLIRRLDKGLGFHDFG